MKIGLIDVDGHNFPNLALMKISAYHKQQGDSVEFVNLFGGEYDKVYQSKVFTFTPDFVYTPKTKQIVKGGTGYDLDNYLYFDIENCYPDYELYNIKDTAYGYLTRGCPRRCPFCIVGKKEGLSSQRVSDLDEFWKGQKYIKLLDPNLLVCRDRIELLSQLAESKAYVDFTQGLDARCLNDEAIDLLMKIKIKMIHFAWDNMQDSGIIIQNLTEFKKKSKINVRKLGVYVLTNYNTNMGQDLYRIYTLRDLGYRPYVMIYQKWKASKQLLKMQRWVNARQIFEKVDKFEDYIS